MNTPFIQINTELIFDTVTSLHKQVYDLEKRLKTDSVIKQIKQSVEQFKSLLPLLQELGNSFFKKRHWEQIFVFLGRPYTSAQLFTFSDLLTYGITRIRDQVSDISNAASGEYSLELQLNKIKVEWETLKFSLLTYSNDSSFIVSNIDAILNLLEDNQLQLQGMLVSRFISGIKEEVNQWVSMLSLVTETIEELVICQRYWMNLESIFAQADLQKQLSEESNKFNRVDKIWKDFIRKIRRTPLVLENALNTSLLSVFIEANAICEEIQRGLETYLEAKRKSFPRFYFLSNEDLLDVLSQTQHPQSVVPHLKKCFDNVGQLQFRMTDISKSLFPDILGVIGTDQEKLNFS
jgi:dynein heavy chain